MFLRKTCMCFRYPKCNITVLILQQKFMKISTSSSTWSKTLTKQVGNEKELNTLQALIEKCKSKILYNSVIETKILYEGYNKANERIFNAKRLREKLRDGLASMQPVPLSLKYVSDDKTLREAEHCNSENKTTEAAEEFVQFPYSFTSNDKVLTEDPINEKEDIANINVDSISDEILKRKKLYEDAKSWMTAYDNFEHDLESSDGDIENNCEINYGTPDPNSKISHVPCGGCGAFLHCKDTGIPGYIPSEIFKNYWRKGGANLETMICQRCYFLNEYNLALQVRISADDYPKILATIRGKQALVVLMVDLMDFPCSIWPGIADILGPNTPIIVVGNKIDLLPKDGKKFLNRINENLLNHIKLSGFATSNILHVSLISATTGFGVEDLITALHRYWKHRGDVYLVGCTNVGKSSLFNALLQSDYCKTQATDLIQRATISQWPGTTLNMLKFPIMRPTGERLYLRHQRLKHQQRISAQESRLRSEYLKEDNTAKFATLIGRIGQSYLESNDKDDKIDSFSAAGHSNASGRVKMGINENHPKYALSRWCFDTPGVVQPDQILHLLTIEELMDTLPKEIIRPKTFCVRPGTSLFIAGLARLDYLEGPGSVRLTVFRSNELPITICPIEEASHIYEELLGTELFKVPVSGTERLSKWPSLESSDSIIVASTDRRYSCNDIVLSSAGWVAINCLTDQNYEFKAWTPERRGIYVRDCLLPKAVTLRGPRISHSIAYKMHRFI